MLRRLRFVFLAMACVALACGVWAEQPVTETTTESATADAAVEPAAERPVESMQMWVDQETGALRAPTQEEAARLSAALQRMFAAEKVAPRVRTDKSGMLAVELGTSMMEFSVVRVEEDGTLTRKCVDDAQQALEFIQAAPAPRVEREEE
ncbi:MAG: hypothetical protein AAGC60_24840 [Acidobacteriota bacterium]